MDSPAEKVATMKRNANLVLNALLYFGFCVLAGTGLLLEFRLCDNARLTVWGMDQEDWRDLHELASYLFVAVVVLHLAMHWTWIKVLAAKHFWATTIVAAVGAAITGAILWGPGQCRDNGYFGRDRQELRERDD